MSNLSGIIRSFYILGVALRLELTETISPYENRICVSEVDVHGLVKIIEGETW